MLSLDSPRWEKLRASGGGTGALARRLLLEIRDGTGSDWPELYHQACHQLTVGEVAYAVVPHAVEIAERLPARERLWPLGITATVAACRGAFPSEAPLIPEELRADYEAAARPALLMATAALREPAWRRGEVVELLGVVAAFQGHCDLAIHLLLHCSDRDLHCPMCGEYIRWREGAEEDDKALDAANPFLTHQSGSA
jgi:hypothetical protein